MDNRNSEHEPRAANSGVANSTTASGAQAGRTTTSSGIASANEHVEANSTGSMDARGVNPEHQAKWFCQCFAGLAMAAFVAVAAFNFAVNPYAQYPSKILEPLVQTSRSQKVSLLEALESAPEGLVLGSSRVLKFEPDYLQAKTGYSFFNAGMNQAKPEDLLAFFRLYQSRFNQSPRMLVVGLDVNSFNDGVAIDARLLSNPDLCPLVPEAIGLLDQLRPLSELLSWQQTSSSLKSLKKHFAKPAAAEAREWYRDDGLIVYHERELAIEDGTYDFESALEYNRNEYRHLFKMFDQLSAERVRVFEVLVEACAKANCELAVFLTPIHPQLQEHLEAKTGYADFHGRVVSFLSDLAEQRDFTFEDYSSLEQFGGDSTQFVDGIHPLETNTRRMADQLLQVTELESPVQFVKTSNQSENPERTKGELRSDVVQ